MAILAQNRGYEEGDTPLPGEANLAQGAIESSPSLAGDLAAGDAVFRDTDGTWKKAVRAYATAIYDGSDIVRGKEIIELPGLTADATYYVHHKTEIESAVYDEQRFNHANMSNFRTWFYNEKIYELQPTVYQYSYVKGDTSSWVYDGKTFDATGQMFVPRAAAASGNKVFLMSGILSTPDYGKIYQYSWTPNDISTCSYDSKYLDVYADVGMISPFHMKIIGNRLYVIGFGKLGITAEQYYITDLTDITTAVHEYRYTFSTPDGFYSIGSIAFISGNKLFFRGAGSTVSSYQQWFVVQYSIPDFEDIRSIKYDNKYYDASEQIDQGNESIFALWVDDEYMYLGGDIDGLYTPYWYQYLIEVTEKSVGNIAEKASPFIAGVALDSTHLLSMLHSSGISGYRTIKATAYTLKMADVNYIFGCSNTSTQTITVPPNADDPIPIGSWMKFKRLGLGALRIAAGSGVTVTEVLRDTENMAITKVAENTWHLIGAKA